MLSRIKGHFAIHWRDIGCELLNYGDVQKIEHTNKTKEEKCFDMLETWLKTDTNASYSKLIDALQEYHLESAIKTIKDKVYML